VTGRYRPVQDEADALEAVVAARFPTMSAEDRRAFPAAVLFKTADLLRDGFTVRLVAYGLDGACVGWRALAIEVAS
jgi:hypothetical protein